MPAVLPQARQRRQDIRSINPPKLAATHSETSRTGKVSVSRYQLDKSSASRQDRDAARRRSRTATSQLRHALRDYKIVLQDDDSPTTHARKPWTVLHSGVVVARFADVGTAAQWVADKAKPEPASWNVFGGFFDAMIP